MARKHHPVPLSGRDRKALAKELGKARAMTTILAARSAEARTKGEALIRTADTLLCESWNERMRADGQPIDPSPSIDQAINGGYCWLEIECSRCKSRGPSILRPCPILRRRSFMTWQADSAAASAARPTAGRPRHCFNSRSAPPKCRRLENCHFYSITQAAISALFRAMSRYVRSATSACPLGGPWEGGKSSSGRCPMTR